MDKQVDFINRMNIAYNVANTPLIQASLGFTNTQQALLDSIDSLTIVRSAVAAVNHAHGIAQVASSPGLASALSIAANPHVGITASAITHYQHLIPKFEIPQVLFEHQKKFQEQLSMIGQPWFSEKIDFNPWQATIAGVLSNHSDHIQTTASLLANVQPAVDLAKTISSQLNSMPNMDFRIKIFASELGDLISERYPSLEEVYYPPEEEIDELLNDTFHNVIVADVPSYKEQYSQQNPERHSDNEINAKKINESVHKSEFLSKVNDPWWYVNFAFDKIFELLIIGIIGYTAGQLNYAQFVYFFNQLLKLFKLNL